MIAIHHAGTLQQDLAVPGDLDVGLRQRPPHRSEPVGAGSVDRRRRRGLGQSVTLEHDDTHGVEPLGDLTVECGRTGDEEPHPSAEAIPNRRQHQSVGEFVLGRQQRRGSLPGLSHPRHLHAHTGCPIEEALLDAAFFGDHLVDLAVHLLKDARDRTHDGRPDDGEVLDDLVHPAVDDGREPDRQRQRQHDLAERMRKRQPQVIQILVGEHPEGIHCGRGVGPGILGQPHALGFPGGARGVDQGGQLIGANRIDAIGHRRRRVGEQLLTALFEVGESDHPVAVTVTVDHHHVLHGGQFGAVSDELVNLLLIFGDDNSAAGVGDDEGHVLGMGGRVHRGGRSARRQDREVDDHPFVAGARGQCYPLFGLDAQRDQACGEEFNPLSDLLPGDGGPAAVLRVPERLRGGSRRDPVEEHPGNRRCPVGDHAGVETFLGFMQACHSPSL